MQFMTHYFDLEFCFLDIKSDSQQNLRPDSDPARRTCSGKSSFDENELDAGGKPSTWFPPEGLVEPSSY